MFSNTDYMEDMSGMQNPNEHHNEKRAGTKGFKWGSVVMLSPGTADQSKSLHTVLPFQAAGGERTRRLGGKKSQA